MPPRALRARPRRLQQSGAGLCISAFCQGCWRLNSYFLSCLPEVEPAEGGATCRGLGAEGKGWNETVSLFAARMREN